MIEPQVILVDKNDQELGTMPKLLAHQQGQLHRAISVFIFDLDGNWVLQQRAEAKYHSSNLWSNTACSHPLPGENTIDAANRRLVEEMGIDCRLEKAFSFIYRAELDNNLIEHELDHVYIGFTSQIPHPNPDEVSAWRLVDYSVLDEDVKENPENYTEWFKLVYNKVNLFASVSKTYLKN